MADDFSDRRMIVSELAKSAANIQLISTRMFSISLGSNLVSPPW